MDRGKVKGSELNVALSIEEKDNYIAKAKEDILTKIGCYKSEIEKLKDELRRRGKIMERNSAHLVELDKQECRAQTSQALKTFEHAMLCYMSECKKLTEFHNSIKKNLITLEMAVDDVAGKYDRAKSTIAEYRANESILKDNIQILVKNLRVEGQRYKTLKQYAKIQLDKAKKQNIWLKQYMKQLGHKSGDHDEPIAEQPVRKCRQQICTQTETQDSKDDTNTVNRK